MGLRKNVLVSLHLANNQLYHFDVERENEQSIGFLDLSGNYINDEGAEKSFPKGKLLNLVDLNLWFNFITTIPTTIFSMTKLKYLNISSNRLVMVPPEIGNLTNLVELNLAGNILYSIPDSIGNLTKLQNINLRCNKLSEIPESIGDLINLTTLILDRNQLDSIPSRIGDCYNLKVLSLSKNNLTTLPFSILRLVNIKKIYIDDNEINLPLPILRFVNKVETKTTTIYDDKQNIHDTNIQLSARKSMESLIKDPVPPPLDIEELRTIGIPEWIVNDVDKYCKEETLHSVFYTKYKELFEYVFERIKKHPERDDIIKAMIEEFTDSKNMCFTGRFTRTINILSGFYDDIAIQISSKTQISAVILTIQEKLELEEKYDPILHRKLAEKQLLELGYSSEELKEWLDGITE